MPAAPTRVQPVCSSMLDRATPRSMGQLASALNATHCPVAIAPQGHFETIAGQDDCAEAADSRAKPGLGLKSERTPGFGNVGLESCE